MAPLMASTTWGKGPFFSAMRLWTESSSAWMSATSRSYLSSFSRSS